MSRADAAGRVLAGQTGSGGRGGTARGEGRGRGKWAAGEGAGGHHEGMAWFLSESLPDYACTVHGLLAERPAQHTILLGAIETLRAAGTTAFGGTAPLFGWWQEA